MLTGSTGKHALREDASKRYSRVSRMTVQDFYPAGRVGTSSGGTGKHAVKSEESLSAHGKRLPGSEKRARSDNPVSDTLANLRAIPKVRSPVPGVQGFCIRRHRKF